MPATATTGPVRLATDRRSLDWNGPTARPFTPIPGAARAQPIIGQFQQMVSSQPDRTAIRDGDTQLTYRELWDAASGLAATLQTETGPQGLIGVVQPAGWGLAVAALACLAAGRPFVVLDPLAPEAWMAQVLDEARPTALVTPGAGLSVATGGIGAIELGAKPGPAGPGWRPAALGPDEPACVLFTSGSTGRPKGIVNSQRNLLQRVLQSVNAAHIGPADRFVTLAPPATIVAVRDLFTTLLAGASVRLVDPQGSDAREMAEIVAADEATVVFAFPSLLRTVVAASPGPAPASLRLVRVGGDTTLWSDADAWREWLAPGAAIQVIYAATEAPMLQWFVDDACRSDDPRVPIGYPLAGNNLALVGTDGGPVPPGETGELVAASPYVALGHLAGGRHTASPEWGPDRMFRTGDLVRQRPDGLLERVGRQSRQVKVRGVNVDLDGVEATIGNHPAVRDVAALARAAADPGSAGTLVVYVSSHRGAPADLVGELRQLMASLPPAMRPGRYYLVADVPRLAGSKLDIRGVQALDAATVRSERAQDRADARTAPVPDALPTDRVGQVIARVWAEVLSVPAVTADDDFFDTGGDSLKAVTFMLAIERELGRELPLTLINEAPRFGALTDLVRREGEPAYRPLVGLKPGTGGPPLFLVHGLGGNVVEMLSMARRISHPGEVIGIQARGLDRSSAPQRSVQAMATEYVAEVKARQPVGPYHLCGYSFGGLVAFEMGRQLAESGDEVGLVGLFDTLMSPIRWPPAVWLNLASQAAARAATGLRSVPLRQWPARLATTTQRARSLWERYRVLLPRSPGSTPARAMAVASSLLVASARYRPGFFPGHLTVFTPARRRPGLPTAAQLWEPHARAVSVVPVGGNHLTMFHAAHAPETAAALARCLDDRAVPESGQ